MSCADAGYGSSLPERKSSAIETTPWDAMYLWRSASVRRSLWHQAPPWHSTTAGNGPCPRGLYTRANSGLSPWRRYSTSSTSKSVVFASRVAVVMGVSFLAVCRIVAHGGLVGKHGRRGCVRLYESHAGSRQHRPVPLRARCRRGDGVRELSHRRRHDRAAAHRDAAASARARPASQLTAGAL